MFTYIFFNIQDMLLSKQISPSVAGTTWRRHNKFEGTTSKRREIAGTTWRRQNEFDRRQKEFDRRQDQYDRRQDQYEKKVP